MAEIMKQQSIGRLGRAEEVAAAVLLAVQPGCELRDWCRPAGRQRESPRTENYTDGYADLKGLCLQYSPARR